VESFMNERIGKGLLIGLAVATLPVMAGLAYARPEYFTAPTYLGGLVLCELLLAAIWFYRKVYFPLIVIAFLLAGSDLPLVGVWTAARWFFLSAGAIIGTFIMLKERKHQFGGFHLLALFAILAALVSAVVSRYPEFALLKAISLLLLFVYAATGARLAVSGRENRFFTGLLGGCELLVVAIAALHLLGREVMGNPNSLGAVMGVVVSPLLLWGTLIEEKPFVHQRRQVLFVLSMYLIFHSQSRSGLAAALAACGLLCLSLRRYKLLAQGILVILIMVAGSAILNPEVFSREVSNLTDRVVYKGRDPNLGVFASRDTPWEGAVNSIHKHFWFGSGFGTADNGEDASAFLNQYGHFATSEKVSSENGSSYLTIVSWVGLLGVLPFLLLLFTIFRNIVRTVLWMWHTGNPTHPAVPIAIVLLAGLINAGLEDWLFAVGYYLCIFFWSLAFVFADVVPSAQLPRFSLRWHSNPVPQGWSRTASN
jgi:O-antigen ligase